MRSGFWINCRVSARADSVIATEGKFQVTNGTAVRLWSERCQSQTAYGSEGNERMAFARTKLSSALRYAQRRRVEWELSKEGIINSSVILAIVRLKFCL